MRYQETQHCGRVIDHDEHGHVAVPKVIVLPCVCDDDRCSCPEPTPEVTSSLRRKQRFHCTGKLVVEGVEVRI